MRTCRRDSRGGVNAREGRTHARALRNDRSLMWTAPTRVKATGSSVARSCLPQSVPCPPSYQPCVADQYAEVSVSGVRSTQRSGPASALHQYVLDGRAAEHQQGQADHGDRAPGPPGPGRRSEDAGPVSGKPEGPSHGTDDPLPSRPPAAAGRTRHRPAHHRHQPRSPAPSPRPPRPGTHTSPLARDLNELPAKYGTSRRAAGRPAAGHHGLAAGGSRRGRSPVHRAVAVARRPRSVRPAPRRTPRTGVRHRVLLPLLRRYARRGQVGVGRAAGAVADEPRRCRWCRGCGGGCTGCRRGRAAARPRTVSSVRRLRCGGRRRCGRGGAERASGGGVGCGPIAARWWQAAGLRWSSAVGSVPWPVRVMLALSRSWGRVSW